VAVAVGGGDVDALDAVDRVAARVGLCGIGSEAAVEHVALAPASIVEVPYRARHP
jgi:hypothetical protein